MTTGIQPSPSPLNEPNCLLLLEVLRSFKKLAQIMPLIISKAFRAMQPPLQMTNGGHLFTS